jgi:WD40 repeat protein
MRSDTSDSGAIHWAGNEWPRRSPIGASRLPWCSPIQIGLLLFALLVWPWLSTFGPASGPTSVRRIRGAGDKAIQTFAFAPDGRTIATLQTDGRVALRGTAGDGGASSFFLENRGHAVGLAFAPDGRSLALSGQDRDVLLYDVRAGGEGRPVRMPIVASKALAFSHDGRILAASSYLDHEVLLWDLAAGRELARLRGHGSPVISLAFAPDDRSLASGAASDEAIVLWDLASGRPQRRLVVPKGPVPCLAYSPDGRWLAAAASHGREGRLWDLEGHRGDRPIGITSRGPRPLSFSPDGRLLAVAGDDGTARLWGVATGAELGRVGGPDDPLTGVAFSPDGRSLAAAGRDADIRLWDLDEILKSRADP